MTARRLQVKLAGGVGTIALDDVNLGGVTAIEMRGAVGEPLTAVLTLQMFELDTDSDDVRVILTERTAETLTRLGWTPPPTEGEQS